MKKTKRKKRIQNSKSISKKILASMQQLLKEKKDMISLAGFPDIPASLPHSAEGEKRVGV